MNDVDPEEMKDESNEWMTAVDRGGLKHVTNMTYCMFTSAEVELRKHLHSSGHRELIKHSWSQSKDNRQ